MRWHGRRVTVVDPHAYLLRALYAAIARPGTGTLPHDLLVSAPAA